MKSKGSEKITQNSDDIAVRIATSSLFFTPFPIASIGNNGSFKLLQSVMIFLKWPHIHTVLVKDYSETSEKRTIWGIIKSSNFVACKVTLIEIVIKIIITH